MNEFDLLGLTFDEHRFRNAHLQKYQKWHWGNYVKIQYNYKLREYVLDINSLILPSILYFAYSEGFTASIFFNLVILIMILGSYDFNSEPL